MRPKLTIGMAVFDDYLGLWPTVQALRWFHPEVMSQAEILVVDNNPTSPDGKMVADFAAKIGARYIAAGEVQGTSAPRDRVFREAAGEIVVCMDAHVLCAPGSLTKTLDWFAANPDSLDLISGPIVYDQLNNYSTHFDDVWSDQMWGTWGMAWQCLCGARFATRQLPPHAPGLNGERSPGRCGYVKLLPPQTGIQACQRCGKEIPEHVWPQHEQALERAGFMRAADLGEPFEIPAMGLGLFACRKEAWLGFNPQFMGFGGEEWYIHEKFRQAGRRCLCLPWLRWNHRFGRPAGVTYPLRPWYKMRNYFIGHTELGLPLERVRDHFRPPAEEWQALTDNPHAPPEWPTQQAQPSPACPTCSSPPSYATLEEWYQAAASRASDINEHCPTLRELAAQCAHVTDFGMRHGVSTVALLAGQPQRLVSYHGRKYAEADGLTRLAGGTAFEFRQGESPGVDIDETDLLFLDTRHTADHLYAELTSYAPKVRRWIVLHDTEIYGESGEGGGPGLRPALRRYFREHPEWTVKRHDPNNFGLTVLTRDPADKPALPSIWKRAGNYAASTARYLAEGMPVPTPESYEARLDICALCPVRNEGHCSGCGCPIEDKAARGSDDCPFGKWPLVQLEMKKAA